MRGAFAMRIIFALMDRDGDGTISLEEFQAAHERIFKAMDADKDGTLTLEEMAGSDRPIVQFERKAAGSRAPSPCEFWQGRRAGADRRKVQSGNPCGDDRDDSIPRQLFHEQIPHIGLYQIQWKT
jgi:hypothetical protein